MGQSGGAGAAGGAAHAAGGDQPGPAEAGRLRRGAGDPVGAHGHAAAARVHEAGRHTLRVGYRVGVPGCDRGSRAARGRDAARARVPAHGAGAAGSRCGGLRRATEQRRRVQRFFDGSAPRTARSGGATTSTRAGRLREPAWSVTCAIFSGAGSSRRGMAPRAAATPEHADAVARASGRIPRIPACAPSRRRKPPSSSGGAARPTIWSGASRRDNARFLAVIGASGSGKSSLVAAGLLPRLAAGAVQGQAWTWVRCTPGYAGDDPFLALAVALERAFPKPGWKPAELARRLEGAGAEALAEVVNAGARGPPAVGRAGALHRPARGAVHARRRTIPASRSST